jgi:two-component system LytT family response regulator
MSSVPALGPVVPAPRLREADAVSPASPVSVAAGRCRVALVDPDRAARALLRRALERLPGVEIVAEAEQGGAAIESVRKLRPDVLFLEAELPDLTGFDVVSAFPPATRPGLVLLTAREAYAARAFEIDAADCVVKPFAPDRIAAAIARARRTLAAPDAETSKSPRLEEWLLVKRDGRSIFVRVAEIDWIESARNNVILHVGAERYVLHETTGGLEKRLPPNRFLRIHRSTIVRIDRIRELAPWFHGDYRVTLKDGTELTLSESHRERLKRFRV